MRKNIVLHNQEGTSDKIYIVSIRDSPFDLQIIAKWGRCGRDLRSMVKGSYANVTAASDAQCDLVDEKRLRGYVDIESRQYDGPLTMRSPEIAEHLEPEQGKTLMDVFSDEKKPSVQGITGETELVCVDNTGLESRFDKGVTYICDPIAGIADMFYAYDKFGARIYVFAWRFGKAK